jgi:hypothetical protein
VAARGIKDAECESILHAQHARTEARAERQCTCIDNYNKVRMYVHRALKEGDQQCLVD